MIRRASAMLAVPRSVRPGDVDGPQVYLAPAKRHQRAQLGKPGGVGAEPVSPIGGCQPSRGTPKI